MSQLQYLVIFLQQLLLVWSLTIKFIMSSMSYQNAKLIGIHHLENENKLMIDFHQLPRWEIPNVVDFSFHGFYHQNILFDIYEYHSNNLPARIAAEFPILSYYLHSGDNWQFFYFSPQVGIHGIVVCATFS